jgi:hydroxyacylglutathione hydrolase
MSNNESRLAVRPVRALSDNYIWLIDAPLSPGRVVVVDPGEAAPVLLELERRGESLAAILLTHHHPDHIGGVAGLLGRGPVPVIGPDDPRISTLTRSVRDADRVDLPELGLHFDVLHVPGHTLSHIAYVGHGALFSGDTLFSAGCGRLFEGTPEQMTRSLDRLRRLPADTRLYCGHEYTAANLAFALAVEPDNLAASRYRTAVATMLELNTPTLPSNLALEILINPFLRFDIDTVRQAAERRAGRVLEGDAAVFGTLRSWKDGFR